MGDFLDKITKRLAAARGSSLVNGKTMTGEQPNQILINPDISMKTENNETNQWAIATPTKKGGWRRVPDTRFNDQDSAHAYGKKYHTSSIFGPQYKVIPHPDNLKEESVNEETKWVKDKHGSGYTSSDGKREIVKHPKGWISRSTTDKHDYSDVYPTQREARAGKYAWAMKESMNEAAKPGAEHFKTVRIGNGEHAVHWKGKRTPYTIFNGSMGASGYGNNIYGIHHKTTGVTRASGTLHQMKSVLMKSLHKDESKAHLNENFIDGKGPGELHDRHHVMFFGRANPPHSGHEKAYNVVKNIARKVGGTSSMLLSRTQDKKKNPLTPEQKERHAKRAFPDVNTSVVDASHPTILHQLSKLHQNGVTHLHVVAGSDRQDHYDKLLHQYNGVEGPHGYYNFKNIQIHSSGERDPDAEGTEGMSASKMRLHAKNNDKKSFMAGAPSAMKPEHREEMFNDLRAGMAGPPKKTVKEASVGCNVCGRIGCKVHKKA
jgi:hypothetical protein